MKPWKVSITEKPYGEMTRTELLRTIRGYTVGDLRRKEVQAELELRQSVTNARYLLWSAVAASVSAFGSMIAAIASLIVLHAK